MKIWEWKREAGLKSGSCGEVKDGGKQHEKKSNVVSFFFSYTYEVKDKWTE
jgi:hypothetical protein